jgi:hypothetical protein
MHVFLVYSWNHPLPGGGGAIPTIHVQYCRIYSIGTHGEICNLISSTKYHKCRDLTIGMHREIRNLISCRLISCHLTQIFCLMVLFV